MKKHLDYCTHIQFPEDRDLLTRKLFDVNMRLFHSSPAYKRLVLDAVAYIEWCTLTEKEGYKKPHGYSGANAGIPWNIISFMDGLGSRIMINPIITGGRGSYKPVESNCGSLTLDKPRQIHRQEFITVEWFNTQGVEHVKEFGPTPGYTIQHEIQHNLGILITDLK